LGLVFLQRDQGKSALGNSSQLDWCVSLKTKDRQCQQKLTAEGNGTSTGLPLAGTI
jgi:hypothetical protein